MRVGFVAVTGRPNVGKSSLVNRMIGSKVSITSARPNTTRFGVRGVLHRPDTQVVFVDTPGLHRPRTALGERLNQTVAGSLVDVDLVLTMVDATAAVGPGDRVALQRSLDALERQRGGPGLFVVVNKTDKARSSGVLERLAQVSEAVDALREEGHGAGVADIEYFPVSAVTGKGVETLLSAVVERLPEGPALYPRDMITDMPEAIRVAELVREQLLARIREELPHSVACQVTEWDWPRIRCEILVERDSQKPIVIGKGGEVLKAVGIAVREQLAPGAHLELFVRVERHWQQRPEALDRLGL